MSARDDYSKMTKIVGQSGGGELGVALDENDQMRAVIARQTAERLEVEAIRRTIPCPTCEGCGVSGPDGEWLDCPDCTDGHISHARAWAIVAAVFADSLTEYALYGTDVAEVVTHLRAVKP